MGAVVLAMMMATLASGAAGDAAPQAPEEAAAIVARARDALGGEERLKSIATLSAEGPFRRLGGNEIRGTVRLTLGVPDRLRYEEEFELPTRARALRVGGLNGERVWEDTSTTGGMGGQIVIRGSGRGPGGPADPEQVREIQRRRLTGVLQRMTLALLAHGEDLSFAGIADVVDGEAYVLERKDHAGHPLRLFVSRETDTPIAISYIGVPAGGPGAGGMMAMGGGGGAGPGGQRQPRRPSDGDRGGRQVFEPEPSTILMRLEDYRLVDGLKLPHLFVQSVDGEPVEEWTVRRYRVNPPVNARVFDTK